jgi:hypothetical protein
VSNRCLGHALIISQHSVPCKHIQRVTSVSRLSPVSSAKPV